MFPRGSKRFEGRVAVVTGGTAGIGLAVSRCTIAQVYIGAFVDDCGQHCCVCCFHCECSQTAERLGCEGAHVVICSRRQKNVDAAVKQLHAQGIACDGLAAHVGDVAGRKAVLDLAASRSRDGKVRPSLLFFWCRVPRRTCSNADA